MSKVLRAHEAAQKEPWLPKPSAHQFAGMKPEVDAREQAEAILQQAREEAAQTVLRAKHEAEQILRDAYDEGYRRGCDEGRQAAEQADAARLAEVEALVTQINRAHEAAIAQAEEDLVRLSVTIAEKLVAQQLALKPESILEVVRTQIKRIREREVLRIRVNPDDMPILGEARQVLLTEIDGVHEIHLYDDRRIQRGGVVIEAESGSLDARVATQLNLVTQALEDALEVPHGSADH